MALTIVKILIIKLKNITASASCLVLSQLFWPQQSLHSLCTFAILLHIVPKIKKNYLPTSLKVFQVASFVLAGVLLGSCMGPPIVCEPCSITDPLYFSVAVFCDNAPLPCSIFDFLALGVIA